MRLPAQHQRHRDEMISHRLALGRRKALEAPEIISGGSSDVGVLGDADRDTDTSRSQEVLQSGAGPPWCNSSESPCDLKKVSTNLGPCDSGTVGLRRFSDKAPPKMGQLASPPFRAASDGWGATRQLGGKQLPVFQTAMKTLLRKDLLVLLEMDPKLEVWPLEQWAAVPLTERRADTMMHNKDQPNVVVRGELCSETFACCWAVLSLVSLQAARWLVLLEERGGGPTSRSGTRLRSFRLLDGCQQMVVSGKWVLTCLAGVRSVSVESYTCSSLVKKKQCPWPWWRGWTGIGGKIFVFELLP